MTYLKGFQPTAFQVGAFQMEMDLVDTGTGAIIHFGDVPAPILLDEDVSEGDLLGYSNGWKRTLATTGSVVQYRCVASKDGVKNQEIIGYFGTVLIGGRFRRGIAGNALYVAGAGHYGDYSMTIPTTSGDADTIVGYMVSETLAVVHGSINDDSTVT